MQYEIVIKGDGCCSYYTCLPQTAPAAQTAQRVVAAPGTSTDAASGTGTDAQRLLTNTTPKQVQHIHIHANKSKL